jgi:hypothetical protein
MISYWNFQGCVLLTTGFAAGVITYTAIAGIAGESLAAKAIAWIVTGIVFLFCDVVWLINRFYPVPRVSWFLRWSGGVAGLPVFLFGVLMLGGGIVFACSLWSGDWSG